MIKKMQTIVFGGGCFWCTEAVFKMIKGVESVEPGYAGNSDERPSYYKVASGATDYVEVAKVEYDPSIVKLDDLLTIFFASHDPTTLNRQGADVGRQYRSVIFYTTDVQKVAAQKFIEEINQSDEYGEPVVTTIEALDKFYLAEDDQKNFYSRNPNSPYCRIVIDPKLKKVKEKFAKLLA